MANDVMHSVGNALPLLSLRAAAGRSPFIITVGVDILHLLSSERERGGAK